MTTAAATPSTPALRDGFLHGNCGDNGDLLEETSHLNLDLDAKAIDDTVQSLRQSLWRYISCSTVTNTSPTCATPQIRSHVAQFDHLFQAILYNFLDGATKQVQDGGRVMDDSLATICAAIASSPADSCALVQVVLRSIPYSIKEAFGRPHWSWQDVRNTGETTQTTLDSATGVYAYHLMNINNESKQNLYVGETTKNFASRWAEHARRRKFTKRPKKYSSKLYGNLKLTRPKDISILILADISVFQKDVLAHKVLARILEAGFCVFFNCVHSSNLRGSDESVSFALRWSVMPSLLVSRLIC